MSLETHLRETAQSMGVNLYTFQEEHPDAYMGCRFLPRGSCFFEDYQYSDLIAGPTTPVLKGPWAAIWNWNMVQHPVLTYYVGMHELGHHALEFLDQAKVLGAMLPELEADVWNWTLENAIQLPDYETLRAILDFFLKSYIDIFGLGVRSSSLRIRLNQMLTERQDLLHSQQSYLMEGVRA